MKRLFDIGVAMLLLLLGALPMALIAALIGMIDGMPVIFRQQRPGRNERPFEILKFRTMTAAVNGIDDVGNARITRLGAILRRYSLDELPELWNVLRGDMSLVGPRPLLMEYLDRYSPRQARRHQVRPGLTGWAQINGRNAIGWTEKLELDVWYVEHCSMWLDLRILWRTAWQVIAARNIDHDGATTMPRFSGSDDAE